MNNTCSSVGTEKCEDGSNVYKCICKTGYSGTECEVFRTLHVGYIICYFLKGPGVFVWLLCLMIVGLIL